MTPFETWWNKTGDLAVTDRDDAIIAWNAAVSIAAILVAASPQRSPQDTADDLLRKLHFDPTSKPG